ncbi:hypothetical protein BDZ89DRAFT_1074584, partial [Hymenopellis radicata]
SNRGLRDLFRVTFAPCPPLPASDITMCSPGLAVMILLTENQDGWKELVLPDESCCR